MPYLPLRVTACIEIDEHMENILVALSLEHPETYWLPFTDPKEFSPHINNCHFNVRLYKRLFGGEVQPGWILGQDRSQVFSEAQFHAVWRSPGGEFIDLTPRSDGEEFVCFIPDLRRDIELSENNGEPALVTYDNVRLLGPNYVTKLTREKRELDTDFVKVHKLWPW